MEDQETNNIPTKESFLYKNRKLLLILASISIVVPIFAVIIILISGNPKPMDDITAPVKVAEKTLPITLSFLENEQFIANSKSSINVLLDTQNNPVSSVEIEIEYDPNAISITSLQKFNDITSALSQSLKTTESIGTEGLSILKLSIDPRTTAQKGYGIIANLIAIPKETTTITFTQNTKIISNGITYSITTNPLLIKVPQQLTINKN